MECALSWGGGQGGLDGKESNFAFLIILCLLNYPKVCLSFPCPLWECETGLLWVLGSMKGEFPLNLTYFWVRHRTQLLWLLGLFAFLKQSCLSLACFSIFSSSSESYVDTTQHWPWLLEWSIVAAYRYKEGLFSCLACEYQNCLHFYFFEVRYLVSKYSTGAHSLSQSHSGGHHLELMETTDTLWINFSCFQPELAFSEVVFVQALGWTWWKLVS